MVKARNVRVASGHTRVRIAVGASRSDVLQKLGAPSSKISRDFEPLIISCNRVEL
jgi:hypothetical protein